MLHLLIILITVRLFGLNECGNEVYLALSQHELFKKIVLYSMLVVLVLDPTAVFIKKLFELISNETGKPTEDTRDDLRVGNIIGKLERLITVALVVCNQYGAVGLILTAKSIARFKQMENKAFAEKYLVGTLTSLTIALIATMMVMFLEKR